LDGALAIAEFRAPTIAQTFEFTIITLFHISIPTTKIYLRRRTNLGDPQLREAFSRLLRAWTARR
jgi:hypothetical protein